MLSHGIMEQVCDLSSYMKFYLHLYANLSEQGVELNFCKITEPRKNQIKIKI